MKGIEKTKRIQVRGKAAEATDNRTPYIEEEFILM
jgi:hypothetical protein